MLAVAGSADARPAPALDARAADALLAQKRGSARRRALEKWADGATLGDLVWVLRRPAAELGDSEPDLLRVALKRCPPARVALRRRLAARFEAECPDASLPHGARPARGPGEEAVPRPAASVFRIGVVLPDTGDYAGYAADLRLGLEAALAGSAAGPHAPDLEFWPTGDDDPVRGAEALEASTRHCGALVGELLSVNTIALATGARLLGVPLVSPTATDESIGALGPGVFQIGPSGWSRAERLARATIDHPGMRVGWLAAGRRNAFVTGFEAAAESLGAAVVWRMEYPSGTGFRDEVRALAAQHLDVLLWDGEPREAETLVRELTRQKVSVRLCGDEGLAPERMHAEVRTLAEGVRYVTDEWRLPPETQALLDSVAQAHGGARAGALHVRGWLTGRALAAALAGGALCPEELAEALRARCGPPPWLTAHHFLDVPREGGALTEMVVRRGRAVPLEP
jgi:ABC-type branched-subunit amino acid transport system substrate-binding protein